MTAVFDDARGDDSGEGQSRGDDPGNRSNSVSSAGIGSDKPAETGGGSPMSVVGANPADTPPTHQTDTAGGKLGAAVGNPSAAETAAVGGGSHFVPQVTDFLLTLRDSLAGVYLTEKPPHFDDGPGQLAHLGDEFSYPSDSLLDWHLL